MTLTTPGALVRDRERDWVVLPSDDPNLVLLRPIGGSGREVCGVVKPMDHGMTVPDFFYEPNACVYCDGSVYDEPQQRASDEAIRRELKAREYQAVVIRYNEDIKERLRNGRRSLEVPLSEQRLILPFHIIHLWRHRWFIEYSPACSQPPSSSHHQASQGQSNHSSSQPHGSLSLPLPHRPCLS